MKSMYREAAVAVRKLFDDGRDPNTDDIANTIRDAIQKATEANERERQIKDLADATGYGPRFGG